MLALVADFYVYLQDLGSYRLQKHVNIVNGNFVVTVRNDHSARMNNNFDHLLSPINLESSESSLQSTLVKDNRLTSVDFEFCGERAKQLSIYDMLNAQCYKLAASHLEDNEIQTFEHTNKHKNIKTVEQFITEFNNLGEDANKILLKQADKDRLDEIVAQVQRDYIDTRSKLELQKKLVMTLTDEIAATKNLIGDVKENALKIDEISKTLSSVIKETKDTQFASGRTLLNNVCMFLSISIGAMFAVLFITERKH